MPGGTRESQGGKTDTTSVRSTMDAVCWLTSPRHNAHCSRPCGAWRGRRWHCAAAMDQAACYDDALLRLLFDAGFMRLRIPEAYGGLGADAVTMCLVLEEAAKVDLPQILSTASVHVQPVRILRHTSAVGQFFGA